jgi:hypothetical protein
MIIGMAFGTVKTPPPTIPTTMAVVDEELWIREVARTPINRPTSGTDVLAINVSANPLPNIFKEAPIRLILNKNRYRKINNWMIRTPVEIIVFLSIISLSFFNTRRL